MTRWITPSMAPVLERLELDRPDLVTTADLENILVQAGVATPVRVVAARLREAGWLLPSGQRGVWEFVPADAAGRYSRHDPVMPLRAFLAAHPALVVGLTFQAGAWAHGVADRVPSRLEIAVPGGEIARHLPETLTPSVFSPALAMADARGVPLLRVESILVHMAALPREVRSWEGALEWLPGLAERAGWDDLAIELAGRPRTVATRTGYLLQGLRPDLAADVEREWPVKSRTWFGRRGASLRHDARWQMADTLLPFDPRSLTGAP